MTHPAESRARYLKAKKIANRIAAAHAGIGVTMPTHEVAELMTPRARRIAADAAGFKDVSDATFAIVVELLREREAGVPA